MFIKLPDGSILDRDGRVLFFSTESFISEVVEGDSCFICGAVRSSKEFNDEHVLPQWILRKYGLHGKSITLPNDSLLRYDKYKVPCCAECNTLMARVVEEPVSQLLSLGSKGLSNYLRNSNPWPILGWLVLIFFKVHYKDKSLRHVRDRRQESGSIADFYDWSDLHHLHCLARAFYTACVLDSSILGTLFVLPAKSEQPHEPFDFVTLYQSQSMLLKLGDIAFIAVLNDSGAAFSLWKRNLNRIRGPLSDLQLREILAIVSAINAQLKVRPVYVSNFDPHLGRYSISAEVPERVELDDASPSKYGDILHYCCREYVPFIKNELGVDIENQLKSGQWTFLFDGDGEFIENSL